MNGARMTSRMHPVARLAAERIGETGKLRDRDLEELRAALERLFDEEELRDAVRELIFIASALFQGELRETAQQLFALVETPPIILALERINSLHVLERAEAIAYGARRFAAFAGDGATRAKRSTERREGTTVRSFGVAALAGVKLR
jgi:hypothetical protein